MKKIIIIFFILTAFYSFSASVNVDELNIIADTHYNFNTSSIENTTYFKLISSFDGGYKFSSQIAFESNTTELERIYSTDPQDIYSKIFLLFNHAEVIARNLADSHLDLSLWTGTHKFLGSGAKYRGYLYYPDSTDRDYIGYYRMRGTGITAGIKFWQDRFRANFHFYENTNFINGENPYAFYMFSFDNEIGLYFNEIPFENDYYNLMVEISYGATFPKATIGEYKAGFTFSVGNNYFDFFLSFGLPKIDDSIKNLSFDDFYLESDLHFKLAWTDNVISFLTRPLYFNEQLSGPDNVGEKSDFDINYKFKVNFPNNVAKPGFFINFQYSLTNPDDSWKLVFAPSLEVSYSGIIWNLATHYDFSRIYIGNLRGDSRIYLEGLRVIVGAQASF